MALAEIELLRDFNDLSNKKRCVSEAPKGMLKEGSTTSVFNNEDTDGVGDVESAKAE